MLVNCNRIKLKRNCNHSLNEIKGDSNGARSSCGESWRGQCDGELIFQRLMARHLLHTSLHSIRYVIRLWEVRKHGTHAKGARRCVSSFFRRVPSVRPNCRTRLRTPFSVGISLPDRHKLRIAKSLRSNRYK